MFAHMRTLFISIAASAFAFDIAASGTLIRPPVIFAIEVAFVLAWVGVYWRIRHTMAPDWIKWTTGLITILGPPRWALFNWCLLMERCVG